MKTAEEKLKALIKLSNQTERTLESTILDYGTPDERYGDEWVERPTSDALAAKRILTILNAFDKGYFSELN